MIAMKKMKSALEIALEKLKNLDDHAKKEATEMEHQKYIQAALSLGSSFLQGKTGAERIRESLNRYPKESREAALKAFLTAITKEMNLTNTPGILEAVLLLKNDAEVQQACNKVKKLHQQQLRQLKEKMTALQKSTFNFLQKKMAIEGIKGSALAGFNIKHLPQWEEITSKLQEEYQDLLQDFRATVLKPQQPS
jgi:DNA-binding transcriptional MerR regulator